MQQYLPLGASQTSGSLSSHTAHAIKSVLLVSLVLVICVPCSGMQDATAPQVSPSIVINPQVGPSTTSAVVTGSGFDPYADCFDVNSSASSGAVRAECQSKRPSDWPQRAHDANHSGYNPDEHTLGPNNVGQLQMRWKVNWVTSNSYVVANNMLYALQRVPWDGLLLAAYSASASAAPVWTVEMDPCSGGDGTSLTVSDGLLYAGCGVRWLLIDPLTGAILNERGGDYPCTITSGGNWYCNGWQFVTGPWGLYEINQLEECWNGGGCGPTGYAAIDSGVAVWNFTGWEGTFSGLLALNSTTGELLWDHIFWNNFPASDPVAVGGRVYDVVGGQLYAFSDDGFLFWQLPFPAMGEPVISGDVGFVGCAAAAVHSKDLCAFSTSTGEILWIASGGGMPVAAANGVIYANGAYDTGTGRRLAKVSGIPANAMLFAYDGERQSITVYGLPR